MDNSQIPDYRAEPSETTNLTRRKMLKCMATWAGTGIIWTIGAEGLLAACGEITNTPGVPTATAPAQAATTGQATTTSTTQAVTTQAVAQNSFSFIQISDTHIGFSTEGVNTNVGATLQQAITRINSLSQPPDFVIHTGDVSHLSKPTEFDTAYQLMNTIKTTNVFYVPGEHDVLNDQGTGFRQRFSPTTGNKSWYSMDYKGVHFIGLSNAGEIDNFGLIGSEQLAWLQKDLSGLKKDTPIVIFAHVPLFTVYKPWTWETKDAAQAIALLKPFSAVTVLNGHIHQVATQVEGNINFYTANSTAFPQHRPGVEKPNAYKLPASDLLQNLGYRTVNILPASSLPTISDVTLAGTPAASITIAAPGTTVIPPPPATVSSNPGFVDVGAETDFTDTATTPKQISLPPLANKTDAQTAFILKLNNQYVGISDVCTHMGCEVSWVGKDTRFECPCHGSQYDITGKNVAGPAPHPLSRFKTQVVNGRLLVSYEPIPAAS